VSAPVRIVIPIHDGYDTLAPCLESVAATVPAATEVELVDDASRDPRVAELLERQRARPAGRCRTRPRTSDSCAP
jgi:hypothetical protein